MYLMTSLENDFRYYEDNNAVTRQGGFCYRE